MDVNEFLQGLADDDMREELFRRNEVVRKADAARRLADHEVRMAIREGMRREFCTENGIMYEHFEAVEDYLEEEAQS